MLPPGKGSIEEAGGPGGPDRYSGRRVELVQKAAKEWTVALEDLGGRNNLLNYRDLKQGTLDLTSADPQALRGLLGGKEVKLSSLFSDPEAREQSLRRVRTVHNKARENFEERGLETVSVACGLATWDNQRASWVPNAPVLLRRATVRALGAAQDEFGLALVDEMEVNPTLLHVLRVDFSCEFDHEALAKRIPDGSIDEPWELQEAYAWISGQVGTRVPGFRVEPRVVLANFAYAKLPMVRDIESALDELVAHPLIAAIAGDEESREAVREQGPGPDAIPRPDQVPLADEFLVLDADSSQNYAINCVVAGQSLIIEGPPGTGKSQTIANLIASLVARGKKVMFVAEKRAAIEAVTKRLKKCGLEDLVLDLHRGVSSRRAFAESVGQALASTGRAPRLDNHAELRYVEKRREELNTYVSRLHEKRDPWGISVYEVRAELLALDDARDQFRLRGAALEALGKDAAERAQQELAEYARLGGLSLAASGSPWARAPVVSAEEVQQAYLVLDQLRRYTYPAARSLLERASEVTGLPSDGTVAGWSPRVELWSSVQRTFSVFKAAVYSLDLDSVCESLAPAGRGVLARFMAVLGSAKYRAGRDQLRSCRADGRKMRARQLLECAEAAREESRRWAQLGGQGPPASPVEAVECDAALTSLLEQLGRLERWTATTALANMPVTELYELLEALEADRATLVKLPELHRLEMSLAAAGLGELVGSLKACQASEETAVRRFRYVWLASVLEHVSLADPVVGAFTAERHERAVEEFKQGDHYHIGTVPGRVRRKAAEAAVAALDEFKEQADLVRHQAALRRRHMPVRDFVRNAADVLLALKPCWAMSPLMVSQLLPPKPYFDVVVFDEASQVQPADAVPAILRGKQLVVAGDKKQLPPTAFFVSGGDEEDEQATDETGPLMAGTKGFESILDALSPLVRSRVLQWHYRSRDERLIAFSNAHFYYRMLTTFAGVGGDQVLRYVRAPHDPSAETNSPAPEVNTVVDLILEHARDRSDESLGVIAMGIKHAQRIEERLRQRLRAEPELERRLGQFFDESREERFFVKNLETVQGDERDAVILSIGYGKNARGDLVYRFGPLLTEGGERRLNVAVTRAKRCLTLVSSFSYQDMDPERSSAEGVKLLRQYLQYVESDGTNLGDVVIEKPALNPFEVDVRDTLARHGLKLTAQYGSSGYWIDFAVQHPTQPGRYVLAIECDGATYHSSESARDRDRLRQEQLEHLGWHFHRIWSSEWFYNKEAALEKVLAAYKRAIGSGDDRHTHQSGRGTRLQPARLRDPEPSSMSTGTSGVTQQTGQPTAPASATRNGVRPTVMRDQPIHAYSDSELVSVLRWIESDDHLRTEDELLKEMMRELGFQRRGRNVVARLTAIIAQYRRRPTA